MKQFVRIVALTIIVATLVVVPVCAENVETKASSYFMTSTAYLVEVSTGKFQAYFSVGAFDILDELGASSIKIQRSSDGNSWTTMKTYSKTNYPYLIGKNTGSHSAFVTYTGTSGYYYRAKITLYAKEGSGTGELVRYTSTLQL